MEMVTFTASVVDQDAEKVCELPLWQSMSPGVVKLLMVGVEPDPPEEPEPPLVPDPPVVPEPPEVPVPDAPPVPVPAEDPEDEPDEMALDAESDELVDPPLDPQPARTRTATSATPSRAPTAGRRRGSVSWRDSRDVPGDLANMRVPFRCPLCPPEVSTSPVACASGVPRAGAGSGGGPPLGCLSRVGPEPSSRREANLPMAARRFDDFGDVGAALDGFEHLPVAVSVTEGRDHRFRALNDAARSMVGGRFDLHGSTGERFPDVDGEGWVEFLDRVVDTGVTISRDSLTMRFDRPDGTVGERYLDVTVAPRWGSDGHPTGTISFARDVTDRVRCERDVQRELEGALHSGATALATGRAVQRALLPEEIPVLPDVDLAARYQVAADERVAGGDWFDVVADGDRVVLVVGDVVGHGVDALVAMTQLRSVLLASLRLGAEVVEALEALDRFAETVPAARRATVCVASMDLGAGRVEYCTAGHPAPLVLSSDGAGGSRYLQPTGSGPLATGSRFRTGDAALGMGDALLLYSDGVLERPGISAPAASVALLEAGDDAHRTGRGPMHGPSAGRASVPERICEAALGLLDGSGCSDDVALVALHRRPAVAPLSSILEITPAAPRAARGLLEAWLGGLGVAPTAGAILVHVVTELVTNVVDHAFVGPAGPSAGADGVGAAAPGPPPPMVLAGRLERTGTLVVEVADSGRWRAPVVVGGRGRGLALSRQLVDRLEIDRREDGTTVRIRQQVSRPAGLLADPRPGSMPPVSVSDVVCSGGPSPVIAVLGVLDVHAVSDLSAEIALAITEADEAVTIDLADVSLLASAGVEALFVGADRAATGGVGLDLIAPAGSAAQQVLALVGLPRGATLRER